MKTLSVKRHYRVICQDITNNNSTLVTARYLQTPSGRIAYLKQEGTLPTVMFCAGFKSDMTGTKAESLAQFCRERGQSFLRFDYSGHGQSEGKFTDGTIGQWKQDTLDVLDQLTQGPIILVGSSMGAWLAMLMAIERQERIKALVGIASAPDFTERLIWDKLVNSQREELIKNKVFHAPSCYGEDTYPITLQLIEEGRNHLLLDGEIPITCPIHLLHGTKDQDVPVEIAYLLKEKLPQAELHIVENGDHRLSSTSDLNLLCNVISSI